MIYQWPCNEGIRFQCTHCDYAATTQGSLKRHIDSKHERSKVTTSKSVTTNILRLGGNSSNELHNSSVLVGNSSIELQNSSILVGNSSNELQNSSVLVGNSSNELQNSSALVENSSNELQNSSILI